MPGDSLGSATSRRRSLSLTELAEARRLLLEDVRPHRASINYFASAQGFYRTANAVPGGGDPQDPPPVLPIENGADLKGITTGLTCFESLDDAIGPPDDSEPDTFSGLHESDRARLNAFAENAAAFPENWRSEGEARRYCVVRAAGPMFRLAALPDPDPVKALLKKVWKLVSVTPAANGIYEVARAGHPNRGSVDNHVVAAGNNEVADDIPPAADLEPLEYRYPPNAFLTYWGIQGLLALPDLRVEMQPRLHIAETWLHSVIGREVALQYDDVHGRDPQQLAWAICGLLTATSTSLSDREGSTREFVEVGLKAFFAQQLPGGTWETGRALFHYPEAGNAYCYVFETLAELLAVALDVKNPAASELRRMLTPYLVQLLDARNFLKATERPLGAPTGGLVGWSSGHHPHRTSPESWATASAYRFLQGLRRLTGVVARDEAAATLRARKPSKGLPELIRRGRTWDPGTGSAGDVLASLFVHPQLAKWRGDAALDPDRPLLEQNWARSSLLFGPPGTGKTTLAEAVAGSLGWDFAEITPADFLDQGTPMVSARADEIFRQLMELDQTVVLFDEIDELIQVRSERADMLSRFFTTTMLPRLTRLWNARKLIFFVNTNSIHRVDPAVARSQRFDTATFVLPPSFERKLAMLPDGAKTLVNRETVYNFLASPESVLKVDAPQAWIAFLRYDQMERLEKNEALTDDDSLKAELTRLGTEVFADWRLVAEVPEADRDKLNSDPYERLVWMVNAYKSELRHQRLDPSRIRVVKTGVATPEWAKPYEAAGYSLWPDRTEAPANALDGAGQLLDG